MSTALPPHQPPTGPPPTNPPWGTAPSVPRRAPPIRDPRRPKYDRASTNTEHRLNLGVSRADERNLRRARLVHRRRARDPQVVERGARLVRVRRYHRHPRRHPHWFERVGDVVYREVDREWPEPVHGRPWRRPSQVFFR